MADGEWELSKLKLIKDSLHPTVYYKRYDSP